MPVPVRRQDPPSAYGGSVLHMSRRFSSSSSLGIFIYSSSFALYQQPRCTVAWFKSPERVEYIVSLVHNLHASALYTGSGAFLPLVDGALTDTQPTPADGLAEGSPLLRSNMEPLTSDAEAASGAALSSFFLGSSENGGGGVAGDLARVVAGVDGYDSDEDSDVSETCSDDLQLSDAILLKRNSASQFVVVRELRTDTSDKYGDSKRRG